MSARKKLPHSPRVTLCPDTIDRARQTYVAAIERARAFDAAPKPLLDNATALLTAHWGRANWTSRAAILKTVDWLLQIAINHPAPARKGRGIQSPLRSGPARA